MEKEEALRICKEVVRKDEVVTVIPIPVATLLLDLYDKVEELIEVVNRLEEKKIK